MSRRASVSEMLFLLFYIMFNVKNLYSVVRAHWKQYQSDVLLSLFQCYRKLEELLLCLSDQCYKLRFFFFLIYIYILYFFCYLNKSQNVGFFLLQEKVVVILLDPELKSTQLVSELRSLICIIKGSLSPKLQTKKKKK